MVEYQIGKTITPFYTSWYTNGSTTSEVTLQYPNTPKEVLGCEFPPFATAITKVGLVRSIDWSYGYAVGLKNFTSGHIALSSVRTDLASNNQWYVDEKGNTVVDTATVALVCETP
ncbi:hypothetical protein PVAND_015123 [Polypedilum vanderplanki]|uniref:Uncharacterized protein n=1 Tax=Polypedilum vanderplanki TaxID=319348 RepID=A0A9J6BBB8_POLVA|nr:hypothetical protein PVAND_015123 [Polypedilum vanderplanki]